jgi:hypothetical protein
MTTHKQTWVKVNAPVDKGIAPLIEALSRFPDVRTLDSCEGTKETGWVCFDCGEENWEKLSEFVLSVIGPPLMEEFGDRVQLTVGISEGSLYRAEMTVSKSVIPAVSKAVRGLSRSAKAA